MDRKKLAELMAEYQGMAQKERPVFKFGDTGEAGGPMDIMDSFTGAPFRTAVRTAQEGDLAQTVRNFMGSFGKDPRNAPSMEDIAIRAGVPEGPASTAAGLLGGFAEPGMPFGAAIGAIKKVGGSNVLDATEEFLKRRQMGPDKLAQAQGRLDQPVAKMDEFTGFDVKNPEHVEIAAQGAMKYGKNPDAANERANRLGRIKEKQSETDFLKKFGSGYDEVEKDKMFVLSKRIGNPQKVLEAQNPNAVSPYVAIKDVSFPLPNYKFKAGNVLGTPGIKSQFSGDATQDFFPWMDDNYRVGFKTLQKAKGPVTINTSSDLIAKGEYLNAIPEGSTINFYSPGSYRLQRDLFPGNPSHGRLETAAKKLESVGFKVNIIRPSKEELLKAAKKKKLDKDPNFLRFIEEEMTLAKPGTMTDFYE